MKQIKLIILLFLFLSLPVNAQDFNCQVLKVHDGDTFTCSSGLKVRLWGIDTPEVPPKVTKNVALINGGYLARDFLKSQILYKVLTCRYKGKSYKRVVAQCYYNNYDIAKVMLGHRLAREKFKYSKGFYSQ